MIVLNPTHIAKFLQLLCCEPLLGHDCPRAPLSRGGPASRLAAHHTVRPCPLWDAGPWATPERPKNMMAAPGRMSFACHMRPLGMGRGWPAPSHGHCYARGPLWEQAGRHWASQHSVVVASTPTKMLMILHETSCATTHHVKQ